MMTVPTARERRNFTFSGNPQATPDGVAAQALEFIAHYLDRIDSHLERIATQLEAGQSNGAKIAQNVHQIAHLIPTLLARR